MYFIFHLTYHVQRIGCHNNNNEQLPGCGGFGKVMEVLYTISTYKSILTSMFVHGVQGNFKALFRSIEEYETSLGINKL
ncbi:hypothetical protein EON65_32505 [archaeon]|nr:MAG: hypothetical protein EON65_32505 [archaeon]